MLSSFLIKNTQTAEQLQVYIS